ncbi:MAG: hypothetical protein P4K94_05970 [Terracidiphilus sp.]|nr:hypothetical protein [Terracidiphilus sp.]
MLSPELSTIQHELAAVYRLYAALARQMDPESGLGGQLLYAGRLHPDGCRLVRAANIAGAASLAASAEPAALRQAVRDGVIDFLVTTLDEALRILKNEIRKRQPVAVGVAAPPQALLAEMLQRGVLPDLLPPASVLAEPAPANPEEEAAFIAHGAQRLQAPPLSPERQFLVLEIPAAWAQRAADFDAQLLAHLAPDDHANRRWLRLSPRYLGSQARRLRSLECGVDAASKWIDWINQLPAD